MSLYVALLIGGPLVLLVLAVAWVVLFDDGCSCWMGGKYDCDLKPEDQSPIFRKM